MSDQLERPGFWGVLPADVRYADISANAKILFVEIGALTNKTGTCWATNQYFATLYKCGASSVSRWVGELVAAGFITSEVSTKAGNRRYLRLCSKMSIPMLKNEATSTQNRDSTPSGVTPEPNSITNNTKEKGASDSLVDEDFSAHQAAVKKEVDKQHLLQILIDIINPKEKPTAERLRVLNGRLKDYTDTEIVAAAQAFSKSDWHKQNKQMSIDNLLAPSKFGRWYAAKPDPEATERARKTNQESVDAGAAFRARVAAEEASRGNK